MADYTKESVEFKEFAGLRNTTTAERFDLADLQVAENVDIDDAKRITLRDGQTQRIAGARHSLWSDGAICLAASGTSLLRVRATGTSTYTEDTLITGLTANARLSCWSVNGVVYWVNGFETGVVQAGVARSFGLRNARGQPVAAAIGGNLPAGRYQYAVTFMRNDGQESGTGLAGTIDLAGRGGLRFSSIPVSADTTVSRKAIYLTSANGEVLYRAMVIDNTDTVADYRNEGYDLRLKLSTQFGEPAPAGHMIAYHKGRMLIGEGSVIWRSEPYRHELFMMRKSFLPFQADINLIAPVEDGFFVGADKTYFVPTDGNSVRTVAEYPAIPGTLSYLRAEGQYLGEGQAGHLALWASPNGHCVGSPGGGFRNITEDRFSYPGAQRGAGILRQINGFNQFLAVLEGSGVSNNAQS